MAITIFFRGVSLMVKGDSTTMKEILFPNAEGSRPPNYETGNNGEIQHADKSQARPHYSGILILDSSGSPTHRKLLGRRVDFPPGNPTTVGSSFADEFPSLHRATNNGNFGVRVLPEEERESGRVATRIVLAGGQLDPVFPQYKFGFEVPGHNGPTDPKRPYAIAARWTTNAASITLGIRTFSGAVETAVTLNAQRPIAYCYSFDDEFPSKTDLEDEDATQCTGNVIDHDFKWLYQLVDRQNASFARWQHWLNGKRFPAPRTDCELMASVGEPPAVRNKEPAGDPPLIPVSTCFPTVFDGP